MTAAPTLVAVSHGTSDPRGQGAIRRLVDGVRDRLPGVDVRQAFVDVEAPDLPTVLAEVSGPVTVVPLLLGAGFHVHVDIATAVDARVASGQPTTTASTLGPDPAITGLLLDRLRKAELTPHDAVVLAVAGSSDVRARLSADRAAAMVATSLRRRVRVGHLGGAGRPLDQVIAEARREVDGPPRREASVAAGGTPSGRVIVASYLLAPGFFASRLDASAADVVTAPLSSGVRLDDRLVDVVVRRYVSPAGRSQLASGRYPHASRSPLARLG
jgi:sirohydrochlorin ferrochelatase